MVNGSVFFSVFLLGAVAGAVALWLAIENGLIRRTSTRTETRTRTSVLVDEPGHTCPECGAVLVPHVEHICEVEE